MSILVAERYRELISAVSRSVALQGGTITVAELPEESNYPAVFTCRGLPVAKPDTALFLFFPTDPLLTSDVLSRIFIWTKSLDAEAARPVILLSAANLPVIQRALQATGLAKSCAVGTYMRTKEGYTIDWPAEPLEPPELDA